MANVDELFFNNATKSEASDCNSDFSIESDLLNALSRINNQSCFVIDFDKHSMIYRTDNLIYVDESSMKDQQRICSNPYWSLVSNETLENLLSIKNNYILIVDSIIDKNDYKKHVCTIDYPIILRGHSFYIHQRFTPLEMRDDGITKSGIFTIHPSSKTELDAVIISSDGRRWRFDFDNKKFNEYNLDVTLTLTEKEILLRAMKGLSNEDIASSLFISINTVKTHKNHIFKKLGVANITEALIVIGNYQLL